MTNTVVANPKEAVVCKAILHSMIRKNVKALNEGRYAQEDYVDTERSAALDRVLM